MYTDSQKNNERVNFVYRSGNDLNGREIELPFRVLVIGAFSTDCDDYNIEKPLSVNLANLDEVMSSLNISLHLTVKNRLLSQCDDVLDMLIPINSMYDFSPDALANNIPELMDLIELRELLQYLAGDAVDKETTTTYLDNMTNRDKMEGFLLVNGMSLSDLNGIEQSIPLSIQADVNRRINQQLDEIIHHKEFIRLESSWRSLQFLLEKINTNDNCTVDLLSVSKEALLDDFDDVPEITHSRFYEIVYSSEFGQFGGRPYGVLVGDFEFGPDPRDVKLAHQLASVASMAHAPFIAGADCALFDIDNISELSRIRDFSSIYEQAKYAKWNSFRDSDEARYFALTTPRFKVREPYRLIVNHGEYNTIGYEESTSGGIMHGVWGNSAYAFTTRLIDSYAKYRWCINITGVEYGKVDGISTSLHEGAVTGTKLPTQVLISDRQLREITSHGFLPLSVHKGTGVTAFFASNSVISHKTFSNDQKGKEASLSHHLGSQLQYLFITCRIAHYLKMMQREHIGAWKNKSEVERELNEWIRQYVSDMDNPTSTIRAKRPLRRAKILVNDIATQDDWYVIEILITPHLKYMGASFTLEESGRLDKY